MTNLIVKEVSSVIVKRPTSSPNVVAVNKGAKGDKGEQGLPGTPGVDGIDGTNGTNGIDGTNGLDGAQGIQGIQGLKGDKGDAGNTNVFIQDTQPASTGQPFLWVQTNISGTTDFTFWIEDGL